MNLNVLLAIFRRNFGSYFSNPTGYVFLCMFVLLSDVAAFWPSDFFNANLANLDQLNKYLPYLMLVFIPAVTMSIWADERRWGTDELLLTIPAGDLDVVLGKYLASVAIFTVSLAFSSVCNLVVLEFLGSPDWGLFFGMYLGYWMVGVTMLAVGMVASFLTTNLTVAFILGVLLNAPLVFLANAETIFPHDLVLSLGNTNLLTIPDFTSKLEYWSISGQFRDFSRGVISLSSLLYFGALTSVMLYLSMVLIGRRHWQGGRDGASLGPHYAARLFCLLVTGVALVGLGGKLALRLDVTAERLNSLSPDTIKLIKDLPTQKKVLIEAYVSPESRMPESYVQTRLNLVSTLEELRALVSEDRLEVRIFDTNQFSEQADRAKDQYGIEGRQVNAVTRGSSRTETIFMGVGVTCGLDKVELPFIDRGIPVEYELARSIATVARQEGQARKKVGVLKTDADLMSGGNKRSVILELEKQYDLVDVDPSQPITETYDVLLAVQPSSLSPEQMPNFIDAVKRGQPTAIFEDPLPVLMRGLVGTTQPKQPPGGMFGMGGPPQPKGEINPLWDLLGVNFAGADIVWQKYNPHPKWSQFPPEFVFVGYGATREPFQEKSPIAGKLQELLFCFPGHVSRGVSGEKTKNLTYMPLVFTGSDASGTLGMSDAVQPFIGRLVDEREREAKYKMNETRNGYTMAALITGKLPADQPMHPGDGPHEHEKDGKAAKESEINVVVVADADCLSDEFFNLRAMGDDPAMDFSFDFDNVTFVLNVIDVLAKDNRYVDIRSRRPKHRTLTTLEEQSRKASTKAQEDLNSIRRSAQNKIDAIDTNTKQQVEKVRQQLEKDGNLDQEELIRRVQIIQRDADRRKQAAVEAAQTELNEQIGKIQRDLARNIESIQNFYKGWAVALPPILPLLLGLAVFFHRRSREREGVSRSRLLEN